MRTTTGLAGLSLAAMLLAGACSASNDAVTAAQRADEVGATVGGDGDVDPSAVVDGAACPAMKNLIDEIGNLNDQSYADADAVREAMTRTLTAMERVAATAPTPEVADGIAFALGAWRPWHEEMMAVGYDFFALEPRVFEMLDDPEFGPEAFAARSDDVLSYALENCGVSQATVDAATGADRVGAVVDLDDPGADPVLVETGVHMSVVVDGEQLTMERGFCDVGAEGVLVGSFEAGDTKVTLLYDTAGEGLATVSVERPGSAGGAQVEVEYGDGRGAFRSPRYVGTFTCE